MDEKLQKFEVREKDGDFFIYAEYLEERTDGLHKLIFDNIPIHVYKNSTPSVRVEPFKNPYIKPVTTINFGFGDIDFISTGEDVIYTDELIEPRVEEMTIEEIEKKLGYQIKIIKEHEDGN